MRFEQSFEIIIPTRIHFGLHRSRKLGAILAADGCASALLCTDRNLVEAGIVQRIEESLASGGVRFVVFDRIRENPDLETVIEARQAAGSGGLDCIVGVGGGGPIDVAKAASVALTHDGDIRDYVAYTTGQKRPIEDRKLLPVVAVPTTAGSGAEVSPVAVIVDRDIRTKIGFFSEGLFPRTAVVDPALCATLPPGPTAGAGLDVLAHAFDAFVSRKATAFSDALAKEAIQLVFRHLRTAVWQGDVLEARAAMSSASIMALMAIYFGKGGAVHTIGEPLGTLCELPHGYACGIAIPAMMEYLMPVCRQRFAEMLGLCGGDPGGEAGLRETGARAWQCLHEVTTLIHDLRLPALASLAPEPNLEELAAASSTHLAVDRVPMPILREDYIRLYSQLFGAAYLES